MPCLEVPGNRKIQCRQTDSSDNEQLSPQLLFRIGAVALVMDRIVAHQQNIAQGMFGPRLETAGMHPAVDPVGKADRVERGRGMSFVPYTREVKAISNRGIHLR